MRVDSSSDCELVILLGSPFFILAISSGEAQTASYCACQTAYVASLISFLPQTSVRSAISPHSSRSDESSSCTSSGVVSSTSSNSFESAPLQ